ncbi:SemiSWEET transporter [Nitratidesulfovibrio sp.]|uniref:SemiSWEET family sugar transporter n=1 Tax=Nitratidesulfovibrio sp. TaxID=2802297 RepID=UPI00333FDCED
MPAPIIDAAALSSLIEAVGYVAGLLTSLAYLPQVVRIARTRSANDISLPTFRLLAVGVSLWLVYGIGIGSWPVMAANAVGLALILAVIWLKLRYSRRV